MMNNVTTDISPKTGRFRQYLLGESLQSSLLRLTLILSAIIFVWFGITLALIIHLRCQKSKQILKVSIPHHHLYDSNSSINKGRQSRSEFNRRCNSPSSSTSSLVACCYAMRSFLFRLLRCFEFDSSSSLSASGDNENPKSQTYRLSRHQRCIEHFSLNSCQTSNKVQLVVEAMTRRSFIRNYNAAHIGKKIQSYREGNSDGSDESKGFSPVNDDDKHPISTKTTATTIAQLFTPKDCVYRCSIPLTKKENDDQLCKNIEESNKLNSKLVFPSNENSHQQVAFKNNGIHHVSATTLAKEPQAHQQRKSLLIISTALESKFKTTYQRRHSLLDDPMTTDGSLASSCKHLPLVMITDTSSSNTNIVELETYEDNHLLSDAERRLSRELRASYRPRHST